MAKQKDYTFPLDIEIELVATKGDKVFKKIMKYGDALNVKKIKGWHYQCYEIGFSQFNKN